MIGYLIVWLVAIAGIVIIKKIEPHNKKIRRRTSMTDKTLVITITLFGIVVVIVAYMQRGELAVGVELALPVILAAVIPIRERSG